MQILVASVSDKLEGADPSDLADRIRHACAYPFARPASSYLFADGGMQPLSIRSMAGRIPVLASGSNASPARLAAKFGSDHGCIPVIRAVLHDFVVVFAGHFTSYGAIPATLARHHGARTMIWVTWLTHDQLAIMHRSEGVIGCREVEQRYDYVELENLKLLPEGMTAIKKAGAYLSRRMLAPDERPIRFAEVYSENCSLMALPEHATLHLVHRLLDPDVCFSSFMLGVLRGIDHRQVLFQSLLPHTLER